MQDVNRSGRREDLDLLLFAALGTECKYATHQSCDGVLLVIEHSLQKGAIFASTAYYVFIFVLFYFCGWMETGTWGHGELTAANTGTLLDTKCTSGLAGFGG